MNRPRRNLRAVIMALFSALLLMTFIIMGVIFNIGVQSFVYRHAENIIRTATILYEQQNMIPPDSTLKAFLTDENHRLPENHPQSTNDARNINTYLQENALTLDGLTMELIRINEDRYYASAMKSRTDPLTLDEDWYMVFYVDVTGLTNFAGMVNVLLVSLAGVIWLVTSAAATLLSGAFTRPIRILSNYSKQIGNGHFASNDMYFNIAEFEELNQSLNHTAEQLARYDNDQKTFFQNVSHELRTPLMSIKCYAEGIECGLMESDNASRTILAETDRLTGLVDDILYISRLDSLTVTQCKETADMSKIAAECISQQQAVADSKNINLFLETDGKPKPIPCSPKHITRAVDNLISNAIRYANSAVIVSCAEEDKYIALAVRDDGPGVTPGDLPHIFERFYKGKNGLTGIGLSMVKSIVEQHRGSVTAENTETGAAFTIKIPK